MYETILGCVVLTLVSLFKPFINNLSHFYVMCQVEINWRLKLEIKLEIGIIDSRNKLKIGTGNKLEWLKLIRNILKAPAIFIFKIAGEKNNTHNGIIYHYDERRENSNLC